MSYILLTSGKNMAGAKRRFNVLDSTDEIAVLLMAFYEAHLNQQEEERTGKPVNEGNTVHEYTSDMLHKFFDDYLAELCCLVRQENDPTLWIPYPKDWIKENCIFMYVRKQHEQQTKAGEPLFLANNTAMEVD